MKNFEKNWKKWIALFMAVLMVIGTVWINTDRPMQANEDEQSAEYVPAEDPGNSVVELNLEQNTVPEEVVPEVVEEYASDAIVEETAQEIVEEAVTEEVASEVVEEAVTEEIVEAVEEAIEEEIIKEEIAEEIAEEIEKEEAEEEAEEEEPVEYGTVFTYADGVLTADAYTSEEAQIPADAQLIVEEMPAGSPQYNDAVARIQAVNPTQEGKVAGYKIYDIRFMNNEGAAIEPAAGVVRVIVNYFNLVNPLASENADTENGVETFAYHILNDGGVEILNGQNGVVVSDAEGNISAFDVSTGSFSKFVIEAVADEAGEPEEIVEPEEVVEPEVIKEEDPKAEQENAIDEQKEGDDEPAPMNVGYTYHTDLWDPALSTLTITKNGKPYTPGEKAAVGDEVKVAVQVTETTTDQLLMFNEDGSIATLYIDLPASGLDYTLLGKAMAGGITFPVSGINPADGQVFSVNALVTLQGSTLVLNWQTTPDDPSYKLLSESNDVQFHFEFSGKLNGKDDYIDWNRVGEFEIDNTGKIGAAKYIEPAAVAAIVNNDTALQKTMVFKTTVQQASRGEDGELIRGEDGHIVYESKEITFTYEDILKSTEKNTEGKPVYRIPDVKAGSYDVNETGECTVPGWTFEKDQSELTATAIVPVCGIADVSLHNQYKLQTGSIVLKKNLAADSELKDGDMTEGQKASILLTITDKDGKFVWFDKNNKYIGVTASKNTPPSGYTKETASCQMSYWAISKSGSDSVTITGLPIGNYTVTETSGISNVIWTAKYAVNGAALSEGTVASGTVVNEGSTEYKFENSYILDKGNLSLDKTVAPDEIIKEADRANIKFKVEGKKIQDGKEVTYTVAELTYADLFKNGEYVGWKSEDLPVGDYTVTETAWSPEGYTVTTTYVVTAQSGTETGGNGVVAGAVPVKKDETTNVKFTNTYKENGEMNITKTFSGITNDTAKKGTKIIIRNAEGKVVQVSNPTTTASPKTYTGVSDTAEYTVLAYYMGTSTTATKTLNIQGLPFGTYTITEIPYTNNDYNRTTTYEITAGTGTAGETSASVTVDKDKNNIPAAKITNKYVRKLGGLKFTKLFVDAELAKLTDAQKAAVAFTLKNSSSVSATVTYGQLIEAVEKRGGKIDIKLGSNWYDGVVTKNANGSYTLEVKNLPANVTYTVTEGGDKDISGFARTTVVKVDGVKSSLVDAGSKKIPEYNEDKTNVSEISFTNEYVPSGTLKVTKTWGPVLSQAYYDKLITRIWFEVSDSEGNPVNHTYTKDGKSVTDNKYTYDEISKGITVEAGKAYYVVEKNANVDGYTRTTQIWYTDEKGTTSPTITKGQDDVVQSDDGLVNQSGLTDFHFVNSYKAGGPGPGTGSVFYKNLSGSLNDQDKYIEGTDSYIVYNRTVLKITQYVDAGHTEIERELYIPVKKAVDEGGLELAPGYYTVKEMASYWTDGNGNYSDTAKAGYTLVQGAAASDLYYDWDWVVYDWNSGTPTPLNSGKYPEDGEAQASFEVPKGKMVGLSFTNNYTPYGALKLTKNFKGLTDAQINNLKGKISYSIDRWNNGGWENYDTVYLTGMTAAGGQSFYKEWTHLPLGEYRIKETIGSEVSLYNRISYVTVKNKSDGTTNTVIISKDALPKDEDKIIVQRGGIEADAAAGTPAAPKVTFDNEYEHQKGSLTIQKTFKGDLPDADKENLTFKIQDTTNSKYVTWKQEGGKYIYTGNTAEESAASSFTYKQLKEMGGTFTLEELPVLSGTTKYRVWEKNQNKSGYNVAITTKVNGGSEVSSASGYADVQIQDKKTASVEFINNYKQVGTLKIQKTFAPTSVATTTQAKNIKFTVYEAKEEGGKIVPKTDESGSPIIAKNITGSAMQFTYSQMSSGAKSYSVAPGLYIVRESGQGFQTDNYIYVSSKVNGTEWTEQGDPEGSASVQKGKTTSVSFENIYDEFGKIVLQKTIAGLTDMDPDQMNSIIFIVKDSDGKILPDNNKNYVRNAGGEIIGTVTYADFTRTKDTEGTYSLYNLPKGDYTVTELVLGEGGVEKEDNPFYGYTRTTTYKVNGGTAKTGETTSVSVNASGSTVAYTNTFTKVDGAVVGKILGMEPATYTMIDGIPCPVWKFEVQIDKPYDNMVIRDVFDTTDATRFVLYGEPTLEVFPAATSSIKVETDKSKMKDGEVSFKLTGVKEDRSEHINLYYYVTVKDADVLRTLNEGKGGEVVNHTFNNTAYYKPLPKGAEQSSERKYLYNYTGLEKKFTNLAKDGNDWILVKDGKETSVAEFEITLNPKGQLIGTSDYLTATDKLSDTLQLVYGSVGIKAYKVIYNEETKMFTYEEDTTAKIGYDYDDDTNIIEFTRIPNGRRIVITYQAQVLQTGAQDLGNKVEFGGFGKNVTQHVKVGSEGGGTATLTAVKFFKFETNNMNNPIAGAKFALYDGKTNKYLRDYVTDANGYMYVYYTDTIPKETLQAGYPYYLVETEAPAGYEITEECKHIDFTPVKGQIVPLQVVLYNEPISTEFELGAVKSLSGKQLEADQFAFKMEALDGAPTSDPTKASIVAKNDASGKAVFGKIPVKFSDLDKDTHTKTFEYKVTELIPNEISDGIEYDTTEHLVSVTVSLNASGKSLDVAVKIDGKDAQPGDLVYWTDFSNTYSAEGEKDIEGVKTLEGKDLAAEKYTFKVTGPDGKTTASVTNDADGKINYPAVKFVVDPDQKAAETLVYDADSNTFIATYSSYENLFGNASTKTVNYTVVETKGSEPGITYSEESYTLPVTVTPNEADKGKLDVSIDYGTADGADFTNGYKAHGIGTVSGKKIYDKALEGDEFSFEVKYGEEVLATVTNAADGTINYPKFEYVVDPDTTVEELGEPVYDADSNTITITVKALGDIPEDVKYSISEVIPEDAKDNGDGTYTLDGIIYIAKTYELTVNAAAAGTAEAAGIEKLNVTTVLKDATAADFTNKYSAQGAAQIGVKKTLKGRLLKAGEFQFTLTDETEYPISIEKTPDPLATTVANDEDGEVVYPKLVWKLDPNAEKSTAVYSEADNQITYIFTTADWKVLAPEGKATLKYAATEVKGDKKSIKYDGSKYELTITLEDNNKGTLVPKVEQKGSILDELFSNYTFVNTYEAEGEATISGSKILNGRDLSGETDEFMFEIRKDGEVLTTVGLKADGTIDYPIFRYQVRPDESIPETEVKDGKIVETSYDVEDFDGKTFTYTVNEVEGSLKGVTYSGETETINATVEVDPDDDSKLIVTITPNEGIDFVNTYKADGSTTIEGTKTLAGRVLDENEFIFEITGDGIAAAAPIQVTQKAAAEGGKIEYPKFAYHVDPDAEAGTAYDAATNTINVTVAKVKDLKEAYSYKVTELKPEKDPLGGITYDKTEYKVSVKVTVNAEDASKLDAAAAITKDGQAAAGADFSNIYKARGSATIDGQKIYSKPLGDRKFSFEVKFGSNVLTTVMNDAKGDISYPTFRYLVDPNTTETSVGVPVYDQASDSIIITVKNRADIPEQIGYTISEVIPEGAVDRGDGSYELDGVIYIAKTYTLTVSAKASGKAEEGASEYEKIDVTPVLTDEAEKTAEATIFENKYTAEGAAQIGAEKTLKGRNLKIDEFSFTLEDVTDFEAMGIEIEKDPNPLVTTVTNNAEGKVFYPKLTWKIDPDAEASSAKLNAAGDQINYIFTAEDWNAIAPNGTVSVKFAAAEVNDGQKGVTYDSKIHDLVIKLTDNDAGQIVPTINGNPLQEIFDDIKFVNIYKADGEGKLEGSKILRGREVEEGEFQFEVRDGNENLLATVSNKADGSINYPVFRYVVDPDAEAGTVYDAVNNKVIVTVNKVEDFESTTFRYYVTEVIPEEPLKGVTYSTVTEPINVSVTVNKEDASRLDVAITPNKDVDFTNTYKADGETTISGHKILEERALHADEFTFVIKDAVGNRIAEVTQLSGEEGGMINYPTFAYHVDPDGTAGTVYDEDANVINVTVNSVKEIVSPYIYQISEVKPEEPLGGVTYDETIYEVAITVGVNAEDASKLDVEATPDEDIDFTNTYEAKGSETVEALKVIPRITEEEMAEYANVFVFDLVAQPYGDEGKLSPFWDENHEAMKDALDPTKDATVLYADNDEKGRVVFDTMYFDLSDVGNTYTYKLFEEDEIQLEGLDYDKSVYTVTITPTDNGDGTINPNRKITDEQGREVVLTEQGFRNVPYVLGATEVRGRKFVKDDQERELTEDLVKGYDGAFSFTLEETDEAGNVLEGGLTETATAYWEEGIEGQEDGLYFSFTTLYYDMLPEGVEAEKHYYRAYEVPNGIEGVTYDPTVHKIELEVYNEYDEEGIVSVEIRNVYLDGVLQPEAQIGDIEFNFTNHSEYESKGSVELGAYKELVDVAGTGKELEAGMFTFEVKDANGNVVTTGTNDADGKVSFDKINYTLADVPVLGEETIKYTISEVNGGIPGIIYTADEYEIEVRLKENGNGTITAKPYRNNKEMKNFEDIYFINLTEEVLGVTKLFGLKHVEDASGQRLAGTNLAKYAGKFTFVLEQTDANWNAIEDGFRQEVTNEANGHFEFDMLALEESMIGEKVYFTVYEVPGNDTNITYDSTVHTLVLEVQLNAEGTGIEAKIVQIDGQNVEITDYTEFEYEFTNKEKSKKTPTPTPPGTTTKKAVKTGDTTNVIPFVIAIVAAAAVIIIIIAAARRRRREED